MSLIEDVGNSFLEGFNKGFSDGRNRIIYLPIMCCEHEMSEIWQGDKRIGAFCPICGRKWEPRETEEHYSVGKMTVHIDEWQPKSSEDEELIKHVQVMVSNLIASDMAILFNSNLFNPDGTVDAKKVVVIKGLGDGEDKNPLMCLCGHSRFDHDDDPDNHKGACKYNDCSCLQFHLE